MSRCRLAQNVLVALQRIFASRLLSLLPVSATASRFHKVPIVVDFPQESGDPNYYQIEFDKSLEGSELFESKP